MEDASFTSADRSRSADVHDSGNAGGERLCEQLSYTSRPDIEIFELGSVEPPEFESVLVSGLSHLVACEGRHIRQMCWKVHLEAEADLVVGSSDRETSCPRLSAAHHPCRASLVGQAGYRGDHMGWGRQVLGVAAGGPDRRILDWSAPAPGITALGSSMECA